MGPEGFQADDVYLRTAIASARRLAHFGHVRMPITAGVFFSPIARPDRRIGFGDHRGEPVWSEVPGRAPPCLRRLIVTRATPSPRRSSNSAGPGRACPSLYDLGTSFQVNVEEGRHLWAMVYLLHTYFGRDGREEAR